jgi:RNA 3'-terminal phosphate cyclase (ATP)
MIQEAEILEIDGGYGEGGGQVIRTCLSLSAITGRAVRVKNVRGGRKQPGLKPQHVMCVKAAARICNAAIDGDSVGSMEIEFRPASPVLPGQYEFNIGTAGSTTLVAQTLTIPLALADGSSTVSITGGTHVDHAPTTDYLVETYFAALSEGKISVSGRTTRHGFMPSGGGRLELSIDGGATPYGFRFSERGETKGVMASVTVSNLLDITVGERGKKKLDEKLNFHADVRMVESATPGAAAMVSCQFDGGYAGFSALGARGKPMEEVSSEAARDYRNFIRTGASVDEHLADQLVLPAVLATGDSEWSTPTVTEHLRTVIWVAQQFVDRNVAIEENETGGGIVRVW